VRIAIRYFDAGELSAGFVTRQSAHSSGHPLSSAWLSLRLLFLNLLIEVIVRVLGLPIGAGKTVSVPDGSVWNEARPRHGKERDKYPSALFRKERQEVFESGANRTFMLDPLASVLPQQRVVLVEDRVVGRDRFSCRALSQRPA
jgi:hypothetical protein